MMKEQKKNKSGRSYQQLPQELKQTQVVIF